MEQKKNPGRDITIRYDSLYDKEAEEAVCGAIILESQAIYEVADILTPEMFGNPKCANLYAAAISLYDRSVKVDMITLLEEIQKKGLPYDDYAFFITNLLCGITSSANIVRHALYIKEAYIRRLFVSHMHTLLTSAGDKTVDIADLLDDAGKAVDSISADLDPGDGSKPIHEICNDVYKAYTERVESAARGETSGITTGLHKLDEATGGWQPGDLIILAARPGVGKTAMMLHFALSAAKSGIPVALFSLEMTARSLAERLFVGCSDIDADRFKRGILYTEETIRLEQAGDLISSLPITIVDTAILSMRKIKNRAMRLHRQGKCGVLFIDYLQLVDMRNDNSHYNREQEVAAASRMAKIIAKELNIPVILLSQLNRSVETRAAEGGMRRPLLSDLRESGAIEQDADIVLFICRSENAGENKGELILSKNRNGRVGIIEFRHNESLTRIYDDTFRYPVPATSDERPF